MRICLPILLVISGFAAQLPAGAQTNATNPFLWMVGKWEGGEPNARYTEHWETKDSTEINARGTFANNGEVVFEELLILKKVGKHWVYIASPGGAAPVLFTLVESAQDQWTFRNAEHDFPQEVVITKQEDGTMLTITKGLQEGKFREDRFHFARVLD